MKRIKKIKLSERIDIKNSNNKNVLITNIGQEISYISAEIFIGKNLIEILNTNSLALLNNYDLKTILLYKSFGIKKCAKTRLERKT